jgi:hypothetical protein
VDEEHKALIIPCDSAALSSLLSRWRAAKQRAKDAKEEADELRDELIATLADDKTPALLAARGLESLALNVSGKPVARLKWVRTNRFDKAGAMRDDPEFIAKHTRLSAPEARLELAE